MDVTDLHLHTVIETKKAHPCGGTRWEIVRTGADLKMKCLTCGRIVLVPADEMMKKVRRIAEEG